MNQNNFFLPHFYLMSTYDMADPQKNTVRYFDRQVVDVHSSFKYLGQFSGSSNAMPFHEGKTSSIVPCKVNAASRMACSPSGMDTYDVYYRSNDAGQIEGLFMVYHRHLGRSFTHPKVQMDRTNFTIGDLNDDIVTREIGAALDQLKLSHGSSYRVHTDAAHMDNYNYWKMLAFTAFDMSESSGKEIDEFLDKKIRAACISAARYPAPNMITMTVSLSNDDEKVGMTECSENAKNTTFKRRIQRGHKAHWARRRSLGGM